MTVEKLKSALKSFNLATTGKKAELAARLTEHIKNQEVEIEETEKGNSVSSSVPVVVPVMEPVVEPVVETVVETVVEPIAVQDAEIGLSVDVPVEESVQEKIVETGSTIGTENQQTAPESLPKHQTEHEHTSTEVKFSITGIDAPPIETRDDSDVHPASTSIASMGKRQLLEEKLCREKAMSSIFARKITTNSKDVDAIETIVGIQSQVSVEPTLNLRINNFQRPLTLGQLKVFIDDLGSCAESENGTVLMCVLDAATQLWVSSIKTHCYVTFNTLEEANACKSKIDKGVHYPTGNPNALTAYYTNVPVAGLLYAFKVQKEQSTDESESPTFSADQCQLWTEEALMKPVEWEDIYIHKKVKSKPKKVTKKEKEKVNTTPAVSFDTANANINSTGFVTKKHVKEFGMAAAVLLGSKRSREVGYLERSEGGDAADNKRSKKEKLDKDVVVLNIDELFNKTIATPALYWCKADQASQDARWRHIHAKNRSYK